MPAPLPLCPAAAGKKPGKKPAGGGSLLGGLFGGKKKKEGERVEEAPGAGTPGSPRMVQVPRPTVVAQPAGGAGGGTVTGLAPAPVSTVPVTTQVTTTTTAVPLSAQAGPIHASP